MSTITVPLPEEDLRFLRDYARRQGTTPEAVLAAQARNLRTHLEAPLHPHVKAATGILPADVGVEEYREHLERKHA